MTVFEIALETDVSDVNLHSTMFLTYTIVQAQQAHITHLKGNFLKVITKRS